MPHGHADLGQFTPRSVFYDQGRFGRLFPTLPPFAEDTTPIRDALTELGAAGGPMDSGDDLSDPVTLITDPAKSVNNPDNPTITAGFIFLGQFLDHDMTFDPTSSLARRQDPDLYGGGPLASPHLYDQRVDGGRTTLLTEEIPGSAAVSIDGTVRHDLPRNSQHVALVGDPRNDENLVVSQLHLAVVRFHNRVVADVKADLERATPPRRSSPRPSGWCAGTTSGSSCTSSCPRRSARRWSTTCWRTAPGTSTGATTPSSRSSSRWPPTASGTPRSGPATGSSRECTGVQAGVNRVARPVLLLDVGAEHGRPTRRSTTRTTAASPASSVGPVRGTPDAAAGR
jgi:hypothetical protein